jgi:hypothetical protein
MTRSMNRALSLHQGLSGLVAGVVVAAGCATAHATDFEVAVTPPTIDRWMYPFNGQVGAEVSIPTFGAILQAGFDDRDAQMVLAFDTGSLVPPGQPAESYAIDRVRLTVFVSVNNQFNYDPTFDSVTTLYAEGDPERTIDTDIGTPTELFAAGYRNGASALTMTESMAHSPFPAFPPREGVRSVFAATVTEAGVATDVSRQVRQRFEATPMAIGLDTRAAGSGLAPGAEVPEGTPLTFDVDLSVPANRAYFQRGLAQGRVVVVVTSLAPASGGPGGGSGTPRYPAFYSKENPLTPVLGYAPKLEIGLADANACPPCPGDFDQDGGVTGADVEAFFLAFEAGEACADTDADGGITGGDLEAFFMSFEVGGC